ncbi:hypothetical protein [Rahnella sikkimica]|uniref:Uncharacterized protein n=1 Tax=Rahnella sikkimica TaxID=1805933 RepID=A0A2L1UN72_9GAMM|nr:hypothetical protein [Rahnella sikkimica]AVF34278.1 hypothetical protein BV494_04735 [Rahnella sikkimica]
MALKATKELKVPLYGVRVMIFTTKAAGDKFLGYESIDTNYSAMVSVLTCAKGIDYIAITFRTLDDYCSETLTHECVHAAWRVLELVGIKVSVDNQEPLAYLAGWLSRQVNNFMMNHIEAQQQPKD